MNFFINILLVCIFNAISELVAITDPCKSYAYEADRVNRKTIVIETPNRLLGTWVSENCETRPGPEYVLRMYTFHADGNYKLLQHHYSDDSCIEPKLSISATGSVKIDQGSWGIPEKSSLTFPNHRKITLIAHNEATIRELNGTMSMECPGRVVQQQWKIGEEKVVFEQQPLLYEHRNRQLYNSGLLSSRRKFNKISIISCLGTLKWTFNELNLIRVQLRPEFLSDKNNILYRHELLLGDIHSRYEERYHYSPSAFQEPLLKYSAELKPSTQVNGIVYFLSRCRNICSILISSTERFPPQLVKKPTLSPSIWGDWISSKCEVRPMGLFLTRYFRFNNQDYSWFGEHRFFSDPFCTQLTFIVTAAGVLNIHANNPHLKLPFASDSRTVPVDFKIEKSHLIVHDYNTLHNLKKNGPPESCGLGPWKLDSIRDLEQTDGCLQLGITVPSIQFEIFKLDYDFITTFGSVPTLFLGQADTENLPRPMGQRPTAFQTPLIQCSYSDRFSNSAASPKIFSFSISFLLLIYLANFAI